MVTAIYLGHRDRRTKLTLKARHVFLVQDTEGRFYSVSPEFRESESLETGKPVVSVTVTNHGNRVATIGNVYFQWGIIRKKSLVVVPPVGVSFPLRVAEGSEEVLIYPADVLLNKQKEDWRKVISQWRFPSIESLFFKIGVMTTIGRRFESRVPRKLLNFISVTVNDR